MTCLRCNGRGWWRHTCSQGEDFGDRHTCVECVGTGMRRAHKWDLRFLNLAFHVAQWSKDPGTGCGAVIVRPDRTVVSLGYNGFPRGMRDDEALLRDREVKLSRTVHCEMNAILHARENLEDCQLYTTPSLSCDRCAVHVIQAGITRCVGPTAPLGFRQRWGEALERTRSYFSEAGVKWVEIDLKLGREERRG